MLIATGLPWWTGPPLESTAVGATLFTTTVVVYSVKPLSLSMMRPLTGKLPLSLNGQLVEALGPLAPWKETAPEPPSLIGPLLASVAVGATLATVIVKVLVSEALSLSVTLTVTVEGGGVSAYGCD